MRESDDLCRPFASFYFSLLVLRPIQTLLFRLLFLVNFHLLCLLASQCEGLLTPGECLTALQGMARRKVPGFDGLPIEFYLKF